MNSRWNGRQTPGGKHVYLATLLLAACSAGLLIAPVAFHRMVFQRRLERVLVTAGHRFAVAGLALLLLALAGGVELAASFVLGPGAAWLAAAVAVLLFALWFVAPVIQRVRHRHHLDDDAGAPPSPSRSSS